MLLRRAALVTVTAALVGVIAAPARAQSGMPADAHRFLVLVHIFAAILFMGNIVVSAMWMTRARRTGNTAVLHFASRTLMRADWLFTLPGGLLLVGSGLLTMGVWGGFGRAHWAEMGLALFLLTFLIWVVALIPLQKRMIQLTGEAIELKIGLSDEFHKTHKRWAMWGGIATLLPFVALFLMVFKPMLWH